MIITHNLSKYFDQFLAVDRVNFNVQAGEVLALLGPNGAGKTTTIRMLTSVLSPSSGWARIAGYDVVTEATQVRASVGVLTEHHGLYNRMPPVEYLNFFGQIYRVEPGRRKQRIHDLLEQFGLADARARKIGEFSKGMRQKLALARALLHDPPVLLLDEPTSAMDPESARLVRDSIKNLRSAERTIIICTHNLAEAEELADDIAIIRKGKIIIQGSPSMLKSNLLGPAEYELHLADHLNGNSTQLPEGASFVEKGPDWIRYKVHEPKKVNPIILQNFHQNGFAVVSLQEVPRSLEQVYMQAIHSPEEGETRDAE